MQGRKIGVLITDGFDPALLAALQKAAAKEKAAIMVVAPKVGGATDAAGNLTEADAPISGAPSVIFDTVAILASAEGAQDLATQAGALDWVSNAFAHLKIIAHTADAQPLLDAAGVKADEGVIALPNDKAVKRYIEAAKNGRLWQREPTLRRPG